jgi:predicted permease
MDTNTAYILALGATLISVLGIGYAYSKGHQNGAESVHRILQLVLSNPTLIAGLQAQNAKLPAADRLIESDLLKIAEAVQPPATVTTTTTSTAGASVIAPPIGSA